jgi:2-polyprenyl-3-methyl-5-hydroxy-6-metoxy-1,4-benzoquinol methylase
MKFRISVGVARQHRKEIIYMNEHLLALESHFSFGENWEQYAQKIDETRIQEAEKSLIRLIGPNAIQGRTFLDLGCGSGLFSLAALRLGCKRLLAIDLDPACVRITHELLQAYPERSLWECRQQSVFELRPESVGTFDVVYSWGVLHHTGAMREAIATASTLVSPGGLLAIAVYGKTFFCRFWRIEKRIYSRASQQAQRYIRAAYMAAFRLRLAMRGESIHSHRENYYQQRGMDMDHDAHDWLGGYPYESIAPREVISYLNALGFTSVRSFVYPCIGLLGNGCDEYCFAKSIRQISDIA